MRDWWVVASILAVGCPQPLPSADPDLGPSRVDVGVPSDATSNTDIGVAVDAAPNMDAAADSCPASAGWPLHIASEGRDVVHALARKEGRLFAGGLFGDGACFGQAAAPARAVRDPDGFVAQWDDRRESSWVQTWGGSGLDGIFGDSVHAIVMDDSGRLHAGGMFTGSLVLDGSRLESAGVDALVTTHDPATGELLAHATAGSDGQDGVQDLLVTADGVVAAGRWNSMLGPATQPERGSLFVWTPPGSPIVVTPDDRPELLAEGGHPVLSGEALHRSGDGHCVVGVGAAAGVFAGMPYATLGPFDTLEWVSASFCWRGDSAVGASFPHRVPLAFTDAARSTSGALYRVGAWFGGAGWNLFVERVGTDGWQTNVAVTLPLFFLPRLVVDGDDNVYVAAALAGEVEVSGATGERREHISALGRRVDALVASWSPTGELRWATGFGGPGWDVAWALALDEAEGVVYVGGSFEQRVEFPSGRLTAEGDHDGFVERLTMADGSAP